ncbi:VAMP-associated protein [Auriculariales sp. MPI-PUGE-AT-0066]|nr:VAMP-associated protein [Auriculariales sp. MPI-PUGE-AT-0066]
MSVALNPSQQLTFSRPLTVLVKRSLSISNPSDTPVAFKVKTTAPKLYCVRPNAGRIEPNETVDVLVMLLPMKEDPPLSTKCKDKFLVQSTAITPEKDHLPTQEVWNAGPGEAHPEILQQKIKVAWLAPEGLPTTEEENEDYPNQSIMSTGEDSMYATVRGLPPTHSNGINGAPTLHDSQLDPRAPSPPIRAFSPAFHDSTEEHHEIPPTITVHTPPRTPPPVEVQAPAYASAPRSFQPDLSAELTESRAEIARLRALLDSMPTPAAAAATHENSLRQRKGLTHANDTKSEDGRTEVAFEQSVDGFSPQQVLFIAGAVFILTYLFF